MSAAIEHLLRRSRNRMAKVSDSEPSTRETEEIYIKKRRHIPILPERENKNIPCHLKPSSSTLELPEKKVFFAYCNIAQGFCQVLPIEYSPHS